LTKATQAQNLCLQTQEWNVF